MANVTFDGVIKRYGDVTAVEDLHLDVADGEFMVLLGPSGCGKSTALRMIAGLEEISGGELRIGDRVVNDVIPSKRDVAMVFQSYALYPHMTVRKNIESPLVTKATRVDGGGGEPEVRKLTGAERKARIDEAARMLDLDRYLDRKPGALSGGQRQRVALGRAIVRKPAVFLFDEPLSNLDAKLRVQMRAEISTLQKRLQTTTVYVTHDQIEAMTMGDRIAVMNKGEIEQVGTPLEVYDQPTSLFVASFIGTPPMNFLPAILADGGATVAASGFRMPVPEVFRAAAAGHDGMKIVLGLRPENIREASRDGSGATVPVTAKVEFVEPLGHEVIVHGRVGDELIVAKVDPHRAPQMGATMTLVVETEAAHLFDTATEKRLGL